MTVTTSMYSKRSRTTQTDLCGVEVNPACIKPPIRPVTSPGRPFDRGSEESEWCTDTQWSAPTGVIRLRSLMKGAA